MRETLANREVFLGSSGVAHFLRNDLKNRKIRRLLVFTGQKSFTACGAESLISEALNAVNWERRSEFQSNPKMEELKNELAYATHFRPDGILAIGGGSVLDMAKLVNFFLSVAIKPDAYLDGIREEERRASLRPLIAIPTTSGTGSEATHFAVLYRAGKKYSVADPRLLPSTVVLNPTLTYTMNAYQTACTGLDALAQGIESFWAVGATPESRKYAEKAIRLALQYLEPCVNHPSPENRQGMLHASYWAGRAIDLSKTTLPHALSYGLTSQHNYPHGHAVGIFLPAVFSWHLEKKVVPEKLIELLGKNDPVSTLNSLLKQIGLDLKKPLGELEIDRLSKRVNPERLNNNPVAPNAHELKEILKTALL